MPQDGPGVELSCSLSALQVDPSQTGDMRRLPLAIPHKLGACSDRPSPSLTGWWPAAAAPRLPAEASVADALRS
eukprot:357016-Chlamydomonas_euryale.AAC.4